MAVAFEPVQPLAWVAFDYVVDVVFVLDLIKNFRTAFVNSENELVQDTHAIAQRYIWSWFFVDLLASIPFELFVAIGTGASLLGGRGGGNAEGTLRLISALKSIRLLRLGRFAKIADKWRFGNVWSILRQYVGIILLAHWLACGWFIVVSSSPADEESWLSAQGLEFASSGDKYIACMLAATLMLFRTLGNPPIAVNEKLYLLIAVLVGAAVHATIFGQVAHLVSALSSRESSYRQRMRQLYDRMRYYGLPESLQERVSIYYETLWKRHRITDTQDMLSFTNSLSEPLQLEVNLFLNREMVQRVPMFKHCHASVIVQVVQSLASHFFMPGDYVVRAGEMGSHMFFIRAGVCQVLVARAKTPEQLAAEAAAAEAEALEAAAVRTRTPLKRLADRLACCTACPCVPAGGLGGVWGTTPADDVRGMELPGTSSGAASPTSSAGSPNPLVKSGSAGEAAESTASDGMQVLPSLNSDEELMVVKTLEPGDFFGEVSLLFRVKRTATICAARYSDLASLDAASFERILETNPDFAAKLEEGFQQYLSLSGGGGGEDGEEGPGDAASDTDSTETLQSPELGPSRFSLGAAAPPAPDSAGRQKRTSHTSVRSTSIIQRSTSNIGGSAALAIASQLFGGGPPVPVKEQGPALARSSSVPGGEGDVDSKGAPRSHSTGARRGTGGGGTGPPPPPPVDGSAGSPSRPTPRSPSLPPSTATSPSGEARGEEGTPAPPPREPSALPRQATTRSAFPFDEAAGEEEEQEEEGAGGGGAPPRIQARRHSRSDVPASPQVSPTLSQAATDAQRAGSSLSRSPSYRVRREVQAAIAAADPADLWTAKVTRADLSDAVEGPDAQAPPPRLTASRSLSLTQPPSPARGPRPPLTDGGPGSSARRGGSPRSPGRSSGGALSVTGRGKHSGGSSVQFQREGGGAAGGSPGQRGSLLQSASGSFIADIKAQARKEQSRRKSVADSIKRHSGMGGEGGGRTPSSTRPTPASPVPLDDASTTSAQGRGAPLAEDAFAQAVAAKVTAAVTRTVGDMLAVWKAEQETRLAAMAAQLRALSQATGVEDSEAVETPVVSTPAEGFLPDAGARGDGGGSTSLLAQQLQTLRCEQEDALSSMALRLDAFATGLHDRLDHLHVVSEDVAQAVDGLSGGMEAGRRPRHGSVFSKSAVVV